MVQKSWADITLILLGEFLTLFLASDLLNLKAQPVGMRGKLLTLCYLMLIRPLRGLLVQQSPIDMLGPRHASGYGGGVSQFLTCGKQEQDFVMSL